MPGYGGGDTLLYFVPEKMKREVIKNNKAKGENRLLKVKIKQGGE